VYGEPFKGQDTIGVYVDLVKGVVFFDKNGRVYGDAFASWRFTDPTNVFYAACSCLTKDETFEVLYPRRED
jgi:molecular chaperone DnaK (HSP70)